jgi:hypothetical protein
MSDPYDDCVNKMIDDTAYKPLLGPISLPEPGTKVTEDSDPTNPSHYRQYEIQPIDFIMRNNLPFWMSNVIKYVMRADRKAGIEDLRKAQKYIEFRINQLEGKDIT